MGCEINVACRVCGNGLLLPLGAEPPEQTCARCNTLTTLSFASEAAEMITRCAACGCTTLYVQRDFNRTVGVGIVVVAALLAIPTYGISLLVAALVDFLLYRLLPRITVCYACDTVHRGFVTNPKHEAYDHHVEDGFKTEKSKRKVQAQEWLRRNNPSV